MKEFWWFFFGSIGAITLIITIPTVLEVYVFQRLRKPDEPQFSREEIDGIERTKNLLEKGASLVHQSQWVSALEVYKQAVEVCQEISWTDMEKTAYGICAACSLSQGKFELCIFYVSKSELNPTDFYNRAIAHYSLENYAECVSDCIEVIRQNPIFAASLWLRGLARLKTGDRSMALDDFKKAATLDRKHGIDYGEDHHGYFFRGLAYARLKKSKRAEEDLKLAHELAIALKDDFFKNKSEQLLAGI